MSLLMVFNVIINIGLGLLNKDIQKLNVGLPSWNKSQPTVYIQSMRYFYPPTKTNSTKN